MIVGEYYYKKFERNFIKLSLSCYYINKKYMIISLLIKTMKYVLIS